MNTHGEGIRPALARCTLRGIPKGANAHREESGEEKEADVLEGRRKDSGEQLQLVNWRAFSKMGAGIALALLYGDPACAVRRFIGGRFGVRPYVHASELVAATPIP